MKFTGIKRGEGYVTLNTAAILDPALSFKAKGLYVLLCTWTPDVPLTVSALERLSNDGRFVVEAAWDELTKAGYLDELRGNVTLRETGKSDRAEFQVTTKSNEAKAKTDLQITPKRRPSFSNKNREKTPAVVGPIQQQVNKKESICISTDVVQGQPEDTLFGAAPTDRQLIMRNTPIADFAVFKQLKEPRELEAMGVDIEHYHRTILRWSDKKNKTRRTAQGWVSTILGSMERDKNENKLKMHDTEQNDNEALNRFLNMGR